MTIEEGEKAFSEGRVDDAKGLFEAIYKSRPISDEVYFKAIIYLCQLLHVYYDREKLLSLISEGLALGKSLGSVNEVTILLTKRAVLLDFSIGELMKEWRELRLFPGWFGHALERDLERFNCLEKEMKTIEDDVDSVLAAIAKTLDGTSNNELAAYTQFAVGDVFLNRYLTYKLKYIQHSQISSVMKIVGFEDYFLYSKTERHELKNLSHEAEKNFIASSRAYARLGKTKEQCMALIRLSMHFRNQRRSWRAKRVLNNAVKVASKSGDQALLGQIYSLQKSIKEKNQ